MLRFSARRVLFAAIVVAVGIGVGAVVYFLVPSALGPYDPATAGHVVEATVTHKAPCGTSDPHDTVSFTTGGAKQQAKLNACGHSKGATVRILAPDEVTKGTLVSLAVTEKGTIPVGYRRIGVALLVLGCVAGAGYSFLFRRGRKSEPAEPGREPEPEPAEDDRAPAAEEEEQDVLRSQS